MKNYLIVLIVLLYTPVIAAAQQDCISAIPITSSLYNQSNAYTGYGIYDELSQLNAGCLQSGEKNDAWYLFHTQVTDSLTMVIRPNNPLEDYDFAIFDITNGGCGLIFNYTADTPNAYPPVSCNFSGDAGTTGISTDSSHNSNRYSPSIHVVPGMVLAINVSNFSGTQSGYTIQFNMAPAPSAVPATSAQAIIILPVSPNPVAGDHSTVSICLPAAGPVSCYITSLLGQRVGIITANEWMAAGNHRVEIPAKSLQLVPGSYFFHISDGVHRAVQQFVVAE